MPPDSRLCSRAMLGFVLAIALALVAHPALAQETDGRWLTGIGIAPVGYQYTETEMDGSGGQTSSAWHAGLGGEATLLVGSGLGAWVFAVELSLMHAERSSDQVVDITSSATVGTDSTETSFTVGPNVRYLFLPGAVRPFAELGVGVGMGHSDAPSIEMKLTTLSAHGGPGLQLKLADAASIDVLVRVAYLSSSGTFMPEVGTFFDPDFFDGRLDVDMQTIRVALHVQLSVWL